MANRRRLIFRIYFALATFEGMLTLAAFLAADTDPSNIWFWGYSRTRMMFMGFVIVLTIFFAGISFVGIKKPAWEKTLIERLEHWVKGRSKYFTIVLSLIVLLIAGNYLYAASGQLTDNLVRVRLERLRPLLFWMIALSGQTVIWLPFYRYTDYLRDFRMPKATMRAALWGFGGSISVWGLISWTRLGLEPDKVGWDNPGVPVLAMQLLAVVVIGLTVIGLGKWLAIAIKKYPKIDPFRQRFIQTDILLAVLIWAAAFLLWMSEPQTPTYFSPNPQPPNFEYYPYSDASLHDIAGQNMIVGEGYQPVAEKPLYSLFLGVTRVLVGQDYEAVISLQIAVLALFPVVVYVLLKRFHHRLTGLFAAGLLIIREKNAIALSPEIRVSHSKLLMTDLPAAFLLAIFVLVMFWWLSNSEKNWRGAILSGGMLGVTLLVRSQAILLIPVVFIGLGLILRRNRKRMFEAGALFTIGVVVVLLPWIWRNYLVTGQFGYSQPRQALYIAKQYSLTPEESDSGFSYEVSSDEYTSLGFAKMFAFMRAYPEVVAQFISAHFLRNEISTLLIFPLSYNNVAFSNQGINLFDVDPFIWQACCTLGSFVEEAPYWGTWDGTLPADAFISIVINLALISLGLGVAWRRWRYLGILPLALHLTYNLSVAIARISGWRLILPVDWIGILYYCIGLAQILIWLFALYSGRRINEIAPSESISTEYLSNKIQPSRLRNSIGLTMAFFLIGVSVPLAEVVIPSRYDNITKTEVIELLAGLDNVGLVEMDIENFLKDDQAVVAMGRMLYPRFYLAEQDEPGGRWKGEAYLSDRLTFYLAGPRPGHVVMSMNIPPAIFPNGEDALILGCQQGNYIHAFIVVLINLDAGIVYSSGGQNLMNCSQTGNQ